VRSSGVSVLVVLCLCQAVPVRAEDSPVQVRLSGDRLEVSAPSLNFVSGKALEHLRNGNSVAFDIQLSVLGDARQTVLRRAFERFVFSYDLWEERFSVARMRTSRGSVGNLSAHSAESWCIDKLSVLTAGLPQDRPLWVRIDVRAQEVRSRQTAEADEDGFSIAALIELFSRPGRPRGGLQWRAESTAFEIANLRRSSP
jgi:hypothetical protein